MKIALTLNTLRAAATDAANRSMKAAGRRIWSVEDADAFSDEYYRLGRQAGWFNEDARPTEAGMELLEAERGY